MNRKISLNSRRKLKPSDADRFAGEEPVLFVELAKVVCSTGMLPQKELHECWQMTNIVNRTFPDCLRVADLAAGHGLLAWILVLLARSSESPFLRTAVAVDIKRPKSADALAAAMMGRWPNLQDSVHYVEGSIDAVTAQDGPSTLFVAAHACGSLSDRVLLAAIANRSPVAIMPCCHSLRKQTATLSSLALASKMPISAVEGLFSTNLEGGPSAPIDQFRIDALSALGYHIDESLIDPEITKFNRIILAQHPAAKPCTATVQQNLDASNIVTHLGEIRAYEKVQTLNVAQIKVAQELSKRPSREWRRSFDLSFWVTDSSIGERLVATLDFLTQRLLPSPSLVILAETEDDAQRNATAALGYMASESCLGPAPVDEAIVRSVTILDLYSDPETLRLAFTYRIELKSSTFGLSKEDAIILRRKICAALKCLAKMLPETFELRGE